MERQSLMGWSVLRCFKKLGEQTREIEGRLVGETNFEEIAEEDYEDVYTERNVSFRSNVARGRAAPSLMEEDNRKARDK